MGDFQLFWFISFSLLFRIFKKLFFIMNYEKATAILVCFGLI